MTCTCRDPDMPECMTSRERIASGCWLTALLEPPSILDPVWISVRQSSVGTCRMDLCDASFRTVVKFLGVFCVLQSSEVMNVGSDLSKE